MKAVVESLPQSPSYSNAAEDAVYGFEVSALLTLLILACALPNWWRKITVG